MSALLALQWEFAEAEARLIQQAVALGYKVSKGECWRSPEQAQIDADKGSGVAHSLHTERLATDLLLFKDGVYLTETADYVTLGAWWKSQGPAYCWGGDFSRPDGDHFSITPDGVHK